MNVFNTSTLEQVFWKIKTFLEKLEFSFLDHSTTNECGTFSYKTALSKANVETNWMVSAKCIYHKKCFFATTTSFFWRFSLSIRISDKYLKIPITQIYIFMLKPFSFIWGCVFLVSILSTNTPRGFHIETT